MMTNAKITGWSKRTGSNEKGVAQRVSQALASPVQCLRTALTEGQMAALAVYEVAADEQVIYAPDRREEPDINAGDRVQLDRAAVWCEVVRIVKTRKGPMSRRVLYVKRL